MTSINSIARTKGSFLQKVAEKTTFNPESEILSSQSKDNSQKEEKTSSENKPETLPSYKAIEELEKATGSADAENLYNARWSLYRRDLEESNAGRGHNEIGVVSQRSWDNSKKIIITEDDAKTHVAEFADKLKEELIKQGKFSSNIENALGYVLDNFKWDVYFEKYPNKDANHLEWQFLHTLASAVDPNRISTIFY